MSHWREPKRLLLGLGLSSGLKGLTVAGKTFSGEKEGVKAWTHTRDWRFSLSRNGK